MSLIWISIFVNLAKTFHMDTLYLVTRPNGTKQCYDFIRRLEKEEGFKKGFFDGVSFPYKELGFCVEKVDHDMRI